MSTTGTPRVWVGCLACYNAGELRGEWFDADDCPTEMPEWNDALKVKTSTFRWGLVHLAEAHEELWVMDHEGFDGLLTGECSPADAQALAAQIGMIEQRGPVAAYVAYRDSVGEGYATLDGFEDAYCGLYDSEADYAMELADEIEAGSSHPVERWPFTCIDWDRAWRELDLGGDNYSVGAPDGRVYVFRGI